MKYLLNITFLKFLFCLLVFNSSFIANADRELAKNPSAEQMNIPEHQCAVKIEVNEAIGASTLDYIERSIQRADRENCNSILMVLNTPGGSLQSTRLIVEKILDSKYPFLCLIAPSGAHAGSAGAIILQACHVTGGLPATNLGAATPITLGGEKMSEDLRKKMINDTVSWVEGLAKVRKRNLKFAKEIVTEAKSVGIEEAVKINAMDILARDEADFLAQCNGKKIINGQADTVEINTANIIQFTPDLRHKILSFISDPELAYLIFMGSLGLIYVELTHPGLIAPGVIGSLGLIFSLVAFHKLEVYWGGLLLILLGIGFLIAEMFLPSFGALGLGGIVSLFVGSVLLFDGSTSGYSLPMPLIFSVVGTLGVVLLGIAIYVGKTFKIKSKDWDFDLRSHSAVVTSLNEGSKSGQVEIQGELWSFKSNQVLNKGDFVEILKREGLMLTVQKKEGSKDV